MSPDARAARGHDFRPDPAGHLPLCTLSSLTEPSRSQLLVEQALDESTALGCETELVRVVDHPVRFGVENDMGDSDAWPALRGKVLAADVLLISTPVWMGQPFSVCKMVLERLDAEISETDDQGACRPTAESPPSRSSATGTAPTTPAPRSSRRSTTSASASRPTRSPTGCGRAMEGTYCNELDEVPEQTAGRRRRSP